MDENVRLHPVRVSKPCRLWFGRGRGEGSVANNIITILHLLQNLQGGLTIQGTARSWVFLLTGEFGIVSSMMLCYPLRTLCRDHFVILVAMHVNEDPERDEALNLLFFALWHVFELNASGRTQATNVLESTVCIRPPFDELKFQQISVTFLSLFTWPTFCPTRFVCLSLLAGQPGQAIGYVLGEKRVWGCWTSVPT